MEWQLTILGLRLVKGQDRAVGSAPSRVDTDISYDIFNEAQRRHLLATFLLIGYLKKILRISRGNSPFLEKPMASWNDRRRAE